MQATQAIVKTAILFRFHRQIKSPLDFCYLIKLLPYENCTLTLDFWVMGSTMFLGILGSTGQGFGFKFLKRKFHIYIYIYIYTYLNYTKVKFISYIKNFKNFVPKLEYILTISNRIIWWSRPQLLRCLVKNFTILKWKKCPFFSSCIGTLFFTTEVQFYTTCILQSIMELTGRDGESPLVTHKAFFFGLKRKRALSYSHPYMA